MFRNDPLESLKVSSTFDSIQFVRDYLQRTIEQQLRNLMMDELPAIIHRLSLQFLVPDQVKKENDLPQEGTTDETGTDPFGSPPLDPVDSNGNLLDSNAISELSLNGGGEMQYLFSQRNLLRLATLTNSHRTLSLFTPGIQDVVFRAWSGNGGGSEATTPPLLPPPLTKTLSFHAGTSTTYTFSDSGSASNGYLPSRHSMTSIHSAAHGLPFVPAHRSRTGRKKKTRVVNLRGSRSEAPSPESLSEDGASDSASINVPFSEPIHPESIPESLSEDQLSTTSAPALTPMLHHKVHFNQQDHIRSPLAGEPIAADLQQLQEKAEKGAPTHPRQVRGYEKRRVFSSEPYQSFENVIGEFARRYDEKRLRQQSMWDVSSEGDSMPPPTYEAATH